MCFDIDDRLICVKLSLGRIAIKYKAVRVHFNYTNLGRNIGNMGISEMVSNRQVF